MGSQKRSILVPKEVNIGPKQGKEGPKQGQKWVQNMARKGPIMVQVVPAVVQWWSLQWCSGGPCSGVPVLQYPCTSTHHPGYHVATTRTLAWLSWLPAWPSQCPGGVHQASFGYKTIGVRHSWDTCWDTTVGTPAEIVPETLCFATVLSHKLLV